MKTLIEPTKDESHSKQYPAGSANPKDLSHLIPCEEWAIHRPAFEAMQAKGLRFALGGGFAFSAYSERCRSTKDMDLFVLPADREAFVQILTEVGYSDYFEQKEYDRSWIYRGYREGAILDIIWEMANHRAQVDEEWLAGGRTICVHGAALPVLPLEELFWAKLYVFQRERCDWTDLLNLLYFSADEIDWDHLLNRVGEDCELIGALAAMFRWMCPDQAASIPDWLYLRLGLWPEAPPCGENAPRSFDRVRLLDSRPWFGPRRECEE